jgi:mannose-1-phosphate guanylyltransferase
VRRRWHPALAASRDVRPKQFRPLIAARSTFQETLARLKEKDPFESPIIITNAVSLHRVGAAVTKAGRDLGFVTLDPNSIGSAKAISIDYAVMEKTTLGAVVPASCGWSDVGSWHAVWELSDQDGQGNAAQGRAVFEDSHNCNVLTDCAGGARRRRRSRRRSD